jgi:hypothetical protein
VLLVAHLSHDSRKSLDPNRRDDENVRSGLTMKALPGSCISVCRVLYRLPIDDVGMAKCQWLGACSDSERVPLYFKKSFRFKYEARQSYGRSIRPLNLGDDFETHRYAAPQRINARRLFVCFAEALQ